MSDRVPDAAVRLRTLPVPEADALTAGRGAPGPGLSWDPDYPTEDTLDALGLLRLAHAETRQPLAVEPRWWLHQIIVLAEGHNRVVGDVGFHGPPAPASTTGGPATVEIGYAVVPGWRGRGVASRACALVLERAWADGADRVLAQAEADNPASRAVLRRCGFRHRAGDWFEVARP